MFDEQLSNLLRQPTIARFSTVRPDGYPHTVPVWFMLDDEDLLVFSLHDTRKVKNALAHPKGCLSVGGDPAGSPGYLIDGDLLVEADPDHVMAARITRHYESPEKAEEDLQAWRDEIFVTLRLKPRRVARVS
jgi:hypothetical protein